MTDSSDIIAVIGFGEAGQTFASAGGWARRARVYDRLTDAAATREAKGADYARTGVQGCDTAAEAVAGAAAVVALVTADQAPAVAVEAARSIAPGALYLDLNSVAPETKRAAARAVEAAGGHYVDVAVMSPVQPAALASPLLLSGAKAEEAATLLASLGFSKIRVVGPQVGRASSIKMIRSVMIKGLEALSAECVLAASEAGVLDEVVASLDASWPGADWGKRADYNLDRMMVHGLRRSAEMEEVVRTLDDLGVGSDMSRGTMARQAAVGALGLKAPPQGLIAKIAALIQKRAKAA
ncbi:NAD(P)-dependent oxidoreductase [Brevundimonas goettingensis]|uniref:NAD(P)-dependent oxidoreductase n=1 Tax=Brevundimonas goettingensis TaxID=2774190 RepID=A0A975BZC9_9CAUL|nr:NAD(P)-dependent oxidoreductase [Brevundimonas goettingensis]QTC89864.1 NAD(P)-dependent oxidoreductase [Brevundimonas goettingensis]